MKLTAQQLKDFDEQGYIVMQDCFSDAEMAVLRAEAEEIYKSNPGEFKKPEQVRASHILVKVEKDAKDDAVKAKKAEARTAANAVVAGRLEKGLPRLQKDVEKARATVGVAAKKLELATAAAATAAKKLRDAKAEHRRAVAASTRRTRAVTKLQASIDKLRTPVVPRSRKARA